MSRSFELECVISNLAVVRDHAVAAQMDEHYLSEIDHLIATAESNKEESLNEHH